MTAETKLRTLASADAALQLIFGTPLFRWFDKQLPQGYIQRGACARVISVSTAPLYEMAGLNPMNRIRFQIDVLHLDPEAARAAASAVILFLNTGADLASNAQFGSPTVTPRQFPNFILSQRGGMDYREQPPVHVETIDVRVYNLET